MNLIPRCFMRRSNHSYLVELTNQVKHLSHKIRSLEDIMANATQQLKDLKSQLSDTTGDILAKLDQLQNAQGDLNPEAQGVLDEIKASVQALDDQIGDADGSEQPQPEQPQPEQPV